MINVEKEEFLKLYDYKNDFSYELFKHFIYFDVEKEDIEDWLHNPFEFETSAFKLTGYNDNEGNLQLHLFEEIKYEDALTFNRVNKAYGRDKKIDFLLTKPHHLS